MILVDKSKVTIVEQKRGKDKRKRKIKGRTKMICKYCGSEWQFDNKFYTIDCCKRCHDNGEDGRLDEIDDEFMVKHRD